MNPMLPNGVKIGQAVAYGACLCVGWTLMTWLLGLAPMLINTGLKMAATAPAG